MTFTVTKKNVIANFAGSAWTALLGLILIPVYIKFLGIEAWAVIGIFTSLQSLSLLLDLGLSATLNREMARLSLDQDRAQEMRDLVRTFELVYWGFAIAAGTSIFLLAPLIANRWVQSNQLSPATIENAIRLMGLAVTFQWPFALYSGGLLGLQRQVLLNGINVTIATLRGLGAVLILWHLSSTLHAFFIWQIVIGLVQTLLAGWFLWHRLPHTGSRSGFQRKLLQTRWRFAAGMSGIIVMSLILTQMDKVILSRLLSLEMFGYYVLASSVATSLTLLVVPLFYALSPKFTQLVSLGDEQGLQEIYHYSCQLVSVVIIPIAIVVMLFSRQILWLWTGNSTTAEQTHLVLSILIAGAVVSSLMRLPYALQLAHGWTRLAFFINVVLAFGLTPVVVLAASRYGAVGAALVLVIFNAAAAIVSIQLMHRRVLKGEQWQWYLKDVGLPLIVSLGTALLCVIILPTGNSRLQIFVVLAGISLLVTSSTIVATPVTREALVGFWRTWRL